MNVTNSLPFRFTQACFKEQIPKFIELSKRISPYALGILAIFAVIFFIWRSTWNEIKPLSGSLDQQKEKNPDQKIDLEKIADVFYKNTSRIEEAQVVFIGEIHTVKKHKLLQIDIINKLARDGDIVLLEGATYKKSTNIDESHYRFADNDISKKINVNGWEENKDILIASSSAIRCGYSLLKIEDFKSNQEVQAAINTLLGISDFLKSKRDLFLVGLIKKITSEHINKKIFVIAGRGHVLEKRTNFNILDLLPQDTKGVSIVLKDKEIDDALMNKSGFELASAIGFEKYFGLD